MWGPLFPPQVQQGFVLLPIATTTTTAAVAAVAVIARAVAVAVIARARAVAVAVAADLLQGRREWHRTESK